MTQMCTGDNPPLTNTLEDLFTLAGLEKHLRILRQWEQPSGCPCTSLQSSHIPCEIYFKSAPTVGLPPPPPMSGFYCYGWSPCFNTCCCDNRGHFSEQVCVSGHRWAKRADKVS
jgi:hypothetical protein